MVVYPCYSNTAYAVEHGGINSINEVMIHPKLGRQQAKFSKVFIWAIQEAHSLQ
jgi:hypothetical protein